LASHFSLLPYFLIRLNVIFEQRAKDTAQTFVIQVFYAFIFLFSAFEPYFDLILTRKGLTNWGKPKNHR